MNDGEAFFLLRDKSTVTQQLFRKLLKQAITNLGLNAAFYGTHSLRRARRASDMLHLYSVSIETIKAIG